MAFIRLPAFNIPARSNKSNAYTCNPRRTIKRCDRKRRRVTWLGLIGQKLKQNLLPCNSRTPTFTAQSSKGTLVDIRFGFFFHHHFVIANFMRAFFCLYAVLGAYVMHGHRVFCLRETPARTLLWLYLLIWFVISALNSSNMQTVAIERMPPCPPHTTKHGRAMPSTASCTHVPWCANRKKYGKRGCDDDSGECGLGKWRNRERRREREWVKRGDRERDRVQMNWARKTLDISVYQHNQIVIETFSIHFCKSNEAFWYTKYTRTHTHMQNRE